ncbi:MAG: AAC(3) family N-acetyltransferase [Chloroflexi bacterium]|nr:AAC(3) family N-acetyltransferase [Chloroflexota bacterium]
MKKYRDLVRALRKLDLDGGRPVVAHASLSAFGNVKGGAEAVVGALLEHFNSLIMPVFTYKTMVTPEAGPPDNAAEYGKMKDANRLAEIFWPGLPADRLMGVVPETLRRHNKAQRSLHPILSFTGINAAEFLKEQKLNAPLGSLRALVDQDGWVLLLGVDHKANTSIHLGERMAGRKTFVRWGLTKEGVLECIGFPPCSDGFNALSPYVEPVTRKIRVGKALVQALSIRELVEIVKPLITEDPLALLCSRPNCMRCAAVRKDVGE